MTSEGPPAPAAEESVGERAYRELAEEHADRVYGIALLLVGDPPLALDLMRQGFQRTWDTIRRDLLVEDAAETLYRSTTREALRRVVRSRGDLRGFLPVTTADDNQITAFGITSGFPAQQQAAIYLAVWARLGYRLAGLASGVGEARARDLVFSARQEYREARGAPPDAGASCHEAAPLLSARADGEPVEMSAQLQEHLSSCPVCRQTSAIFDEFSARLAALRLPNPPEDPVDAALAVLRAGAERHRFPRILRLMAGPAILTVVLIGALFVLRGFGEPEIATGVGRTSDLLYARDANGAIVVLDSGSGRELGRLPNGVLAQNGQRVYGVSTACQEGGCSSTVQVTDTATMVGNPLGRLEGRLALLGVDEVRGRLYLTDDEGSRLLAFDSALGQVVQEIEQPDGLRAAFAAGDAVVSADGSTLFTLGSTEDAQAAAVVTNLLAGRVQSTISLPGAREEYAGQLHAGGRLFAYQLEQGTVHEIDPGSGRVTGNAQVDPSGGSRPAGGEDRYLAAPAQSALVYAVVPSGGIAIMQSGPIRLSNRLAADRQFRSVSASSDGSLLYTIESDGSYAVLQATSGQQLVRRANVNAVALLQANAGE